MKYTNQQIQNWRDFEEVRSGGEFNMLSREARELTGLDKEEFLFVMKNYTELKSLAQDDDARRFFKGESYRSEDSQD